MYLHAYGKSVIEIATNAIAFVTEFLPFVIKLHGGVINLRAAFTVEIKGLAVGIFPATFGKINQAIKNYFVFHHEFCFNLEIMEQNCNTFGARSIPSIIDLKCV